MNKPLPAILFAVISAIFLLGCPGKTPQQPEIPTIESLSGPYLGQRLPGTEPEIFAPGIITTHYSQSYIAFLFEGRVCVFSSSTEKGHETYYTYEKDGNWTKPLQAPFEELQGHPNYTTGPWGKKVYFHSGRPTHPGDTREDDNIWTIEWNGSGWNEPEALPFPAGHPDYGEAYPTAAKNGSVYFFSWRRPDTKGDDIYRSSNQEGIYQEVERLPWPVNTDFIEYDPYVAPDESFLIFGSTRPGGFGKSDNYICFRKADGTWTSPLNLGNPLNTSSFELCPNGTPDGKFFFFLSGRITKVDKGEIGKKAYNEDSQDSDLYWVDFSFADKLRDLALNRKDAAEAVAREYAENGIESAVQTFKAIYEEKQEEYLFRPYDLLALCKNMLLADKLQDADLLFAALNEKLSRDRNIEEGYGQICVLSGLVEKGLKAIEDGAVKNAETDLADSLGGLGYLLTLYPDKKPDALAVLQFTVEKFPRNPFTYYSLARVYRDLGNLDEAIENCRKSLEILPDVGDRSQFMERLLKEKEEKR